MNFDEALAAIMSLEALWLERGGDVHLSDLGVGEHKSVLAHGHIGLPPERWRDYPGSKIAHQA